MKHRFELVLAVTSIILAAWYFTRPVSHPPGLVEKEVRGFGKQLVAALEHSSTFSKTAVGYEPTTDSPQPPDGMKPQELQAWTALASRDSSTLQPGFPEHYSSGTVIRSRGIDVTLTPRNANAAVAQIENGKLVYHNAYASTDSLNVVSNGRSEEFLLLHNASAPQRFDYDLSAMSGVKDIKLSGNSIHFTNAVGQKLEIEAPWLVESGGNKVAGAVHWEISHPNGESHPHLALVVSNAGALHYPVVIDPTWAATNAGMSNARTFHTATLLNNGLVLVAGGEDSTHNIQPTELYDPAKGTWSVTGNLNVPRFKHTAVLMADGTVLVAGGENSAGTVQKSCEIYSPSTGTWTATTDMHNARMEHTMTVLNSGLVLVIGGYSGSAAIPNSETYNLSTKVWTAQGSLTAARYFHTATLLPNGTVLVAGGINGSPLITTEIYHSDTNVFSSTGTSGNMKTACYAHTATLLNTGKVLVVGGLNSSFTSIQGSQLYDPTAGTWANSGNPNTARDSHTATLLPNGQVLISGGEINGITVGGTETYDPSSGTFTLGAAFTTSRTNFTTTLLANGEVLAVGGSSRPTTTSSSTILTSVELLDSWTQGWTQTPGSMLAPRSSHTATLLPSGKVLVAGGLSGGTNTTGELYDPADETWSNAGNLHTPRWTHTATLLTNGKVLLAGGIDSSGQITTSAELYDPVAGTFTGTGDMKFATSSHTATLLQNGKVLVCGGINPSALNTAELYDPIAGSWSNTGPMNNARDLHTATLLPNGKVLVAGGDSTGQSAELYDPVAGTFANTGNLQKARSSHTATLLPNGKVFVVGGGGSGGTAELYDPVARSWTSTVNPVAGHSQHTAALLLDGQVLIAGGSSDLTTEIYNPSTGKWTTVGNMTTQRTGATVTFLPSTGGTVLVTGGTSTKFTSIQTSEFFHLSLGDTSTTDPKVNAVSSLSAGSNVTLNGPAGSANFTGPSEASGGNTASSATNFPIVQLRNISNDQVTTIPVNPALGYSFTQFNGLAPGNNGPGYTMLTMFVNGSPSSIQIVPFTEVQTVTGLPATQSVNLSVSPITLPKTTDGGSTITYTVSGPATISGNKLTLTGGGTVTVTATVTATSTYAAFSASETITVDPVMTFAQWCQYYGIANNPTGTTFNDGVENYVKFVCGVSPKAGLTTADYAKLPHLTTVSQSGTSYLVLEFNFSGNANGVNSIQFQTSSDLATWSTVTPDYSNSSPNGNDMTIDYGVKQPGPSKLFLRVSFGANPE